jgi:hypothetical protein
MKKRIASDQPEAPAVITRDHVRDRVVSPVAGAAKAWRKLSPLEAAYAKGQLAGGNPRVTAAQRFEAGQRYAAIFAATEAQGRDSTQLMNVTRSYGGAPLGMGQRAAMEKLRAIESAMGANDAAILRKVCGEGFTPAEAVRLVCGDYRDTVTARFREALDALAGAFTAGRGAG